MHGKNNSIRFENYPTLNISNYLSKYSKYLSSDNEKNDIVKTVLVSPFCISIVKYFLI